MDRHCQFTLNTSLLHSAFKEFPLVAFIVINYNVAVVEGVWSHQGGYRMVASTLSTTTIAVQT